MRFLPLLLLFTFYSTAFESAEAACRQDLPSNARSGSFNGTCYTFFTGVDDNYRDAEVKCKDHNGQLAQPKNEEINKFLADFLSNELPENATTGVFWIGLTDLKQENVFIWADGSTFDFKTSFHNFGKSEGPKHWRVNIRRFWEDCVAIDKEGVWHDYRCTVGVWTPKKHFICESPM